MSCRFIHTGRRQKCRCGRMNPVLHVYFGGAADIDISACGACDGLQAKSPKELRG